MACKIVKAQVCLNTCGDTLFDQRDGQPSTAERTCLRRMYSNPERVIGALWALRNSSGTGLSPLTANHARTASVSKIRGPGPGRADKTVSQSGSYVDLPEAERRRAADLRAESTRVHGEFVITPPLASEITRDNVPAIHTI